MKTGYTYTALIAFTALLWGTANPQSPARTDANDSANDYANSLSYEEYLADNDLRATELVGKSVRNAEGEELGQIEELLIPTEDADDMLLIVSVGGVLNIGDKLVAVPYEELRVSPDGGSFFVNRTQEQLEAEPAFSFQPEQQAARTSLRGDERRPVAAVSRSEQASEQHSASAASRSDGSEDSEQHPATAAARSAEGNAQTTTSDSRPAPSAADAPPEATLSSNDYRASTIIGATVIDNRGEAIGEIDDLVLSVEGEEVRAVLSIGGVVGIGDKLIAVPLEELQIAPPAPSATDHPRIQVNMTAQELLDSKPEFKYERDGRTAGTAGPA